MLQENEYILLRGNCSVDFKVQGNLVKLKKTTECGATFYRENIEAKGAHTNLLVEVRSRASGDMKRFVRLD